MGKYHHLGEHLKRLDRARTHRLSFAQIETVLGFRLPASARAYQAWWANQLGPGHVQANAWLDNGWHTEGLSLDYGAVTFRAVALPRAPRPTQLAKQPGMTIEEAKRAVAAQYGIREDQVEITVRA